MVREDMCILAINLNYCGCLEMRPRGGRKPPSPLFTCLTVELFNCGFSHVYKCNYIINSRSKMYMNIYISWNPANLGNPEMRAS